MNLSTVQTEWLSSYKYAFRTRKRHRISSHFATHGRAEKELALVPKV